MTNYTTDKKIEIKELKCSYYISSAHRSPKKNPKKSYWIVNGNIELDIFKTAKEKEWGNDNTLWGLHLDGEGKILDLGENTFKEKLKIARFIDKNNDRIWHGYPADFVRNKNDRPEMTTLKEWKEKDYIEKHHILKIRMGKQCNL